MSTEQEAAAAAAAPEQSAVPRVATVYIDQEKRLAGKIAGAIGISEVAYFVGLFLALGMNASYYGINAWPQTAEAIVIVFKAFGWALLSWVRVGWLLLEFLSTIAFKVT